MRKSSFIVLFYFCMAAVFAGPAEDRAELRRLKKAGDATAVIELAEALLAQVDDAESDEDLLGAIEAHQQLNQAAEAEALVRKVIASKAENWRIWWAAARAMDAMKVRYGVMREGSFVRGESGEGELWSGDRDRAESIQWYLEAWQRGAQNAEKPDKVEFIEAFSKVVRRREYGWMVGRSHGVPLPNYGELSVEPAKFSEINRLIKVVESPWDAENDGELFRWAIEIAKNLGRRPKEEYDAAMGEALMDHYGLPRGHAVDWWNPDPEFENRLRSLSDTEFLEDGELREIVAGNEFVSLLEPMALSPRPLNAAAERARERLAAFCRARLQYSRLVGLIRSWLKIIPQESGDDIDADDLEDGEDLEQTPRGRWNGLLDELVRVHVEIPQVDQAFPLGRPPELNLLIQNAEDFVVSAQPIDLRRLLKRIETYLRSDPDVLDFDRMDLDYLQEKILLGGWSDLLGDETFRHRYVVESSEWHRPMPRKIRLPLNQGGPWMVNYELPSGDHYFQLLWMADISAVVHHGGGESRLMMLDAINGKPIGGAKLTVLGWKSVTKANGRHRLLVSRFQRRADAKGQVLLSEKGLREDFTWMMWMESEGRLGVLPELSGFRPSLQRSPARTLRVLMLPEQSECAPGATVNLSLLMAYTDHLTVSEKMQELAGKRVRVRLSGEGRELPWIERELDRFGMGQIEVKLPDDLKAGTYRWEVTSEDIEAFQVDAGQGRPGDENMRPVISGQDYLVIGETERRAVLELAPSAVSISREGENLNIELAPIEGLELEKATVELAALSLGAGLQQRVSWRHKATDSEVAARGRVVKLWRRGWSDTSAALKLSINVEELDVALINDMLRLEIFDSKGLMAHCQLQLPAELIENTALSLEVERKFVVANQSFNVGISARAASGDPIAVAGELLVERRFENGFDLVESIKFNSSGEPANLSVLIADAGNYRLRALFDGEDGRAEQALDVVCVSSEGGGSRIWVGELGEGVSPPLVNLIAEKSCWNTGEQARILVQSRWPEQDLFVIRGNAVIGYESELITTHNHGAIMEISVDDRMVPDISLVALAVRGAKLGRHEIELLVAPKSRQLQLHIDNSAAQGPTLHVKDAAGGAVTAQVLVRYSEHRPAHDDEWVSPLSALWQWRNPRWFGLSHSLRSFGSRGYADISSNSSGLSFPVPSGTLSNEFDSSQMNLGLFEPFAKPHQQVFKFTVSAETNAVILPSRSEQFDVNITPSTTWLEVIAIADDGAMGHWSGSLQGP